jgi:hypothetical protein
MEFTINIPGLDNLAIAINNLATAYGSQPAASAEGNEPKPARRGRPAKSADETPSETPTTASSAEPATTSPSEQPKVVVDAGTGQTVAVADVQTTDGLTDERKAEIKGKAAKLTQIPDGNATLAGFLAKYEAPSFGKVPADKLLSLEADIDGALALA